MEVNVNLVKLVVYHVLLKLIYVNLVKMDISKMVLIVLNVTILVPLVILLLNV